MGSILRSFRLATAGTVLALIYSLGNTATAAPQEWAYTYTNLCDGAKCLDLTGTFVGDDVNHDGLIKFNELISLTELGYAVFPAVQVSYGFAGTYSFEFDLANNALSFVAQTYYNKLNANIVTGDRIHVNYNNFRTEDYLWTPNTTLTLSSVSPVPEPSSLAYLTLGIAGLSGLAWRKGRRSRDC